MKALSDFEPKLNPWFNSSGEHAGPAEFRVQGGPLIRGQGVVEWDATGKCRISVDVVPSSLFDVAQHLISDNPLIQFRLEANDGVFEAASLVASKTQMSTGSAFTARVELHTLAGEFTPTGSAEGKYWVAPLVNYVSHVKFRSDETDAHPLRLFPTPVLPSDLPEQQQIRALLIANSKNHLIPFEYDGRSAFIELLPDYKKQLDLLESGATQRAATAIAVGSIGSHTYSNCEKAKTWFPFDMLFALSFASGAQVSSGFIEIRDSSAQLVKRFHISTAEEKYEAGPQVINEVISSGGSGSATGKLINAVLGIADPEKRRLIRVVISHAVRAGLLRQSLENSFDHLVRGFETFTGALGLSSQDLMDGVPINEQVIVKRHLAAAKDAITAVGNSLRAAGNTAAADRVQRIAARAASANQRDLNFGLAISSLLSKYNLIDEQVINNHYQATPRSDGRSWAQVLSAYRGGVIHIGYLEMTSNAALLDVYRYVRHLHDLLVRIILVEIEYTGSYQPIVSNWLNPKTVDWVSTSTPISELGYQ